MNNKIIWIVFGAIIVIGLVALIIFSNEQKAADPNSSIDATAFDFKGMITDKNLPESYTGDAVNVTDIVNGKIDSKVVLIEWQNYQCSACYSLSPGMREIYDTYQDRVAFVYRYLYLQGHPNGFAASVAAEAAYRQGKFHEMNDLLFITYTDWTEADAGKREDVFAQYAEQVGLDVDKWREDYKNYEKNGIKTRLDFQDSLGRNAFKVLGVNGYTPFIMVNGVQIESKDTKNNIIKALDAALAE